MDSSSDSIKKCIVSGCEASGPLIKHGVKISFNINGEIAQGVVCESHKELVGAGKLTGYSIDPPTLVPVPAKEEDILGAAQYFNEKYRRVVVVRSMKEYHKLSPGEKHYADLILLSNEEDRSVKIIKSKFGPPGTVLLHDPKSVKG